jgi:hypothetical protein
MCNANNHWQPCECGFGGKGHKGKRTSVDVYIHPDWIFDPKEPRSYITHNATCPVCGDPVFFYQSPDGGKVYFDELGSPWPKHPCTSTEYPDKYLLTKSSTIASAQKKNGWKPFVKDHHYASEWFDNKYLGYWKRYLVGYTLTDMIIYDLCIENDYEMPLERLSGRPLFLRECGNERVEISTFSAYTEKGEIILRGIKMLSNRKLLHQGSSTCKNKVSSEKPERNAGKKMRLLKNIQSKI